MPVGLRALWPFAGLSSGGAARACAILYFCLLFSHLFLPFSMALTLERPDVNVDWSKTAPAQSKSRPKLRYAPDRLFGTVEFRGPIKKMPQWERVLRGYADRKSIDQDFSQAQLASWNKLKADAEKLGTLDKLVEVNKFFNRWPYRSDLDIYGVMDYWATPAEFIKNSGDCEDYAITKMFALIQLGVDPSKMRVVVLKDQIRNVDHAVLAVYVGEEVYVLDNASPMVLPHSKYGHYRPVVSFNLAYRWAHVVPSN